MQYRIVLLSTGSYAFQIFDMKEQSFIQERKQIITGYKKSENKVTNHGKTNYSVYY